MPFYRAVLPGTNIEYLIAFINFGPGIIIVILFILFSDPRKNRGIKINLIFAITGLLLALIPSTVHAFTLTSNRIGYWYTVLLLLMVGLFKTITQAAVMGMAS